MFAAENMDVEMGHFLTAIGSGIGQEPVARLGNAEIPGDLADGPGETDNFRVRCGLTTHKMSN